MEKAMTRIEGALARIEAAGAARNGGDMTGGADRDMREKVEIALRQLDILIAEMGE